VAVDLYSTALIALVVVITGVLSIRLHISSSILEAAAGIVLGSFLGVKIEPWLDFLGTFGGLMLTFLAGAEVDLILLRKAAKPSFTIGVMAFLAPLAGEVIFLSFLSDWPLLTRLAASIALTTTSVAVVYAVLLEYELLDMRASRLIIAATFVNDILTLIAINLLSPSFNLFTVAFLLIIAFMIIALPKILDYLVESYGKRAVELELRFIFAAMLGVSFIADAGKLHAVFGAFVLGLVFANCIHNYDILPKARSVTFSLLSPAFFVRAGLLISLPAVIQNMALILGLLGSKMLSKFIGTYYFNKKWISEAPMFATMLLSTGLTVGTITATLGRDLGFLDQTQFSVVVITVILSAIIPTLISKKFVPTRSGAEK
jgi:glutathione-regulated potassium-efflux system ancillary protein KefC